MTKPNFPIHLFLFISCMLLVSELKAQDSVQALKPHQFKLTTDVFTWNGSYEARLTNKVSLVSAAGIAFGGSSNLGRYSTSQAFKVMNPEIGAELRYYYNFGKRTERKKKTINNSANFFSFSVLRGFMPFTSAELTTMSEFYIDGVRQSDIEAPIEQYATWSIGPNWGIQRPLGKHFSMDIILGAGAEYLSDEAKWYLSPNLQLRLGYVVR